jgi:hypothetical protein
VDTAVVCYRGETLKVITGAGWTCAEARLRHSRVNKWWHVRGGVCGWTKTQGLDAVCQKERSSKQANHVSCGLPRTYHGPMS